MQLGRVIINYFRRRDAIDWIILILVLISVLLLLAADSPNVGLYALGFKYDFIPLIAFLFLRRMPWSDWFWMNAQRVLLIVGGIVAAYGIITFFLPEKFFYALGYSDAHSLYQPGGPLAAFQQISSTGIRRIQSTMSGPNQLGIWLLIPLSIAAAKFVREKRIIVLALILLIALTLTFSRSAWIAAFVIACVIAWRTLPAKFFAVGAGGVVIIAAIASLLFPSVLIRRISLAGHLERPVQAVRMMMAHPFGLGLGSAGPASNRVSDTCVYLDAGADASWAKNSPELCIFIGGAQIQPADPCTCPFLPENWYLQIGVELGMAGFLLYIVMIAMILWRIRKTDVTFLAFLGISIAALFLHAWEDAAVAYIVWTMVAVTLRVPGISKLRQS